MPQKFRKRPVEIEAVQFTGSNMDELQDFTGQEHIIDRDDYGFAVLTLEGFKPLPVDYWVIKGIAGEVYPCEPTIFYKTYEAVQ